MKKLLLILICLFVSFEVNSKETDFNDLIERDGLYYKKFTDVPFTGKVFHNEISKRTKKIIKIHKGEIKKGKKKGKWLGFSPEGNLTNKSFYKNGLLHGKSTGFYDGRVSRVENYKNGKLHGKSFEFDEKGNVDFEQNYRNGKYHGKTNIYFTSDDGNHFIFDETNYVDGFIDYQSMYNENGNLMGRTEYDYEKNIKVDFFYDKNGKLSEKTETDLEEWEKFPVHSKEYKSGEKKRTEKLLDYLEKEKNKESK